MPEGMNTPGSDLSPEDLERITMLCAHPQLLNYQRVRHTIYRTTPTAKLTFFILYFLFLQDARGRRGAIYIPAEVQQTQAALHSFSGDGFLDNPVRRESFGS